MIMLKMMVMVVMIVKMMLLRMMMMVMMPMRVIVVMMVMMMLLTAFIGDAIADAVLPNSHFHLRGCCCSFVVVLLQYFIYECFVLLCLFCSYICDCRAPIICTMGGGDDVPG